MVGIDGCLIKTIVPANASMRMLQMSCIGAVDGALTTCGRNFGQSASDTVSDPYCVVCG